MFAEPVLIRLITVQGERKDEPKTVRRYFIVLSQKCLPNPPQIFCFLWKQSLKFRSPLFSKDSTRRGPGPVIIFIKIIIGQVSWLTPRAMRRWLKHLLNTSLTCHKKIINVSSFFNRKKKKSAYLTLEKKEHMNTHLASYRWKQKQGVYGKTHNTFWAFQELDYSWQV